MRKWELLALLLAMALLVAASWTQITIAADSFTVTAVGSTDPSDWGTGWPNSFKVIKAAWKSADTTGIKANETIPAVKGKLVLVVTDPGATAPTDNYDFYLKDQAGADILGGAGENRDTANTEQIMPKFGTDFFAPRPIYGPMAFSISGNSASAGEGDVYLYFVE